MIESLLNLARPAVRNLKPYSSARSINFGGNVFLDANESPWGDFNRYPEPQPSRLREKLATLYGRNIDEVFLGRGTDEAIDTLIRTFCEAGSDSILICPPTYGVYEVAAQIQGAQIKTVPTSMNEGFSILAENIISAHEHKVKLVFLCSPNNPTGNSIGEETMTRISDGLSGKAIVVIDEAYIEFSDAPSFSRHLSRFPNVVVLRTLSKAWGLAGARCGVALGHPGIIALLQKVRAPYPLGTPTVRVALESLTPEGAAQMKVRAQNIVRARESMRSRLNDLPIVEYVFPSNANFLLIKVKSAAAVMETCRTRGIVIRDRSSDVGLKDCVRITMGTEEQNLLVLRALSEVPYEQ